jgi:hypothetical protein
VAPAPTTPWRVVLLAAAMLALLASLLILSLTHGLFVFSEARREMLWPVDGDLARFLLFPQLEWGHGRLTGIAAFQLTGLVCGVDAFCVNASGAALIGLAVIVTVVHTFQLTGTLWVSLAIAALWTLSPTVLGISLWQSTRFDILAFIVAIGTSALWWAALGRASLSRAWLVAIPLVSVLLMAVAFNAKEVAYYLAGVLLLLAVVRGAQMGRVRRNLLVAAVPVAYAAWFVAYGLIHIAPDYAANSSEVLIPGNLVGLVREALGISPGFMGIHQPGRTFDALQAFVRPTLLAIVVVVIAIAVVIVLREARRRPTWSDLLGYGAEVYLVAVIGATMLANARSAGASAYYLPIPYWAALVLAALLLRRLARRPAWRRVAQTLAGAAVVVLLVAYASHFAPRSAWAVLSDASARMRDVGSVVRTLLEDKAVRTVLWRTIGDPNGHQYVLRGIGRATVGDEIWPFLVGDASARPRVEALPDGDVGVWRVRAPQLDAPGDVLLVLSEDYRLLLLAHEGEVLFERPA